ncbi:tetratricopeptide repeat protein [Methanoculleus oceani]|uniref:Tetratricopeptide repeat-containing protein n=1 Tax=Methanoculleus oceani TaxID=2184756 RepID=A0ABD4TJ09_9EURY|nr:tetratricopeptide repeat protein [Methanoculleus sp. CWC-02]MCM2467009.1 tetratricopeptide repeat-containing protein [Methanoculleus sp. CWC-02]
MPRLVTPEIPGKGDDRTASRAYTDVIVENLQDPAALNNRGVALERQGRYEEALAAFSAALLYDNDDVYAWNNRAVILTRLDRPQEAVLACRQALAIDRSCIFAWVTYGMVLGRLGNYQEAEHVLAVAEDLDPQARALYPGNSTMTRA